MLNKKLILVLIFFISLIAVSAVSASENATEQIEAGEIDSLDDEISAVAIEDEILTEQVDDKISTDTDNGTFSDLQDKINAASEGGTIYLNNNYTNNGSFSGDGIIIEKPITIEGNGFTIDAASHSRIFTINATTNVTLNNITFKFGSADYGGAVKFNQNISDCTISNCMFSNNNVTYDGGALYFNGDIKNVTISNTVFTHNEAGQNGGAIYVLGFSDGNTFENANFLQNRARSWDGGAIDFFKGSSNTLFNNSDFAFNVAYGNYSNGGAINCDDNFTGNTFQNCGFSSNSASKNGGAMFFNKVFDGNSFENVNFHGNSAVEGDGGAINFYKGSSNNTFNNSKFDWNHAHNSNGGAINCDYGDFVNNTFYNTIFIDNVAKMNGGAIYILQNSALNTYSNASFINNVAKVEDGGAINFHFNLSGDVFDGCIFEGNHGRNGGAINIDNSSSNNLFNNTQFIGNVATSNGGAFYVLDVSDSDTFKNTRFINNLAEKEDGGAMNFHSNLVRGTFDNDVFINNTGSNGGAVNVDRNSSYTSFDGTKFINNTARLNGGAFYVLYYSYHGNFTNSEFTGNVAEYEDGGAINYHLNVYASKFDGVTFRNNSGRNGGAINMDAYSEYNSFNNTVFIDNVASRGGGAVFALLEASIDSYNNTKFINNVAALNGGAINYYSGVEESSFDNVTFANNHADNGGAISARVTNTTIANSEFKDNTAILGTNNVALIGEENFKFDHVTPENPGPFFVGHLEILNVTDNVTYGGAVKIVVNVFDGSYFPLNNGTVSVILNGKTYDATVSDGNATIIIPDANAGEYDVNLTYIGNDYVAISPVKFNVLKLNTAIAASNSVYINPKLVKNYAVVLKDSNGKALANMQVTLKVNGVTYKATTNSKGEAVFKINKLTKKGKYVAEIAFAGDKNHIKSTASAVLTVKKATPKIVAKKKKFKAKVKTKKYAVTLKDNNKKPIKNARLTLKIKGKKFTAKTNSKGKAVFKIKKLTKKGKYTAKITFKANNYYNAAKKSVKITIK